MERGNDVMYIKGRLHTLGLVFTVGFIAPVLASGNSSLAIAEEIKESTKEILAVQIRRQGYSCANPVSAQRDSEISRPDEEGWILKCENGTYRVRLVPDMAAKVERVD